jgi:methionyl-tRNA formyltransferase
MKIIFMGTPDFAVPIFKSLVNKHDVRAVFTQPDRPKGRGMAMQQSPVKQAALESGVQVWQPETLRNKAVREKLAGFNADIFIVAAYGLIIPERILSMPPLGCVNVHASLLPAYRGASPIHRSLMNGDTVTGITIMHMDRGIDTGDIILQRELSIGAGESFLSLHDRMSALGSECIMEALTQIGNGTASRTPQNEAMATYAPLIKKTDGLIDWNQPGIDIVNRVRAFDPWPGAYTLYNGQTVKIWRLELSPERGTEPPGTMLAADNKKGILVQTADSAIWITEIQALGKKRMPAADYLRGHKIQAGEVFT